MPSRRTRGAKRRTGRTRACARDVLWSGAASVRRAAFLTRYARVPTGAPHAAVKGRAGSTMGSTVRSFVGSRLRTTVPERRTAHRIARDRT